MALEELIAVAPDAIFRVGILYELGISAQRYQKKVFFQEGRPALVYFVFQPSWADLTFCLAVASVKGGSGGRAVEDEDIIVTEFNVR